MDASVLLAAEDVQDPNHAASSALLQASLAVFTLDLAHYEVANVAIRRWNDPAAAARLRRRVEAIASDGHLVRVDEESVSRAANLARAHGISVYDAAYAVAATGLGTQLVSCDVKDLVGNGLAILPAEALTLDV